MGRIGTGLRDLTVALRPLASFAWRMLATLTICRTVFVVYQWEAIRSAGRLGKVYAEGLLLDLALTSLVLIIPLLVFPLLVSSRHLLGAWRTLLAACLPAVLLAVVLIVCATPSFVDPLAGRPGLIFFEYLRDPATVAAGLWKQFHAPILLATGVGLAACLYSARRLKDMTAGIRPIPAVLAIAATLVLLAPWIETVGFIEQTVAAEVTRPALPDRMPLRVASYTMAPGSPGTGTRPDGQP